MGDLKAKVIITHEPYEGSCDVLNENEKNVVLDMLEELIFSTPFQKYLQGCFSTKIEIIPRNE